MNIVFYAYGNHKLGMGHIYRSTALISAFKKKLGDVSPLFLSLDYQDGISKIKNFGYPAVRIPAGLSEPQEIEYCSRILDTLHPEVIIADALQVSPAKMKAFKERSKYLVSIDDTGDGRLLANLALNLLYQAPTMGKGELLELTDLKYFILREECTFPPEKTIKLAVQKILVTQGGSDSYGLTVKIARALKKLDNNAEVVLLLGPAFKHDGELQVVLQNSKRQFTVKKDVPDVVNLFAGCDLAITAAGITLFELAAVGVPCVVLTQEPREIETANRVESYGFIINLGLSQKASDEALLRAVNELTDNYRLRRQMSEKARSTIDGRGAERVVDVILSELNKFNRS